MKLSKNRLKEILKEEISLYINSVKTEKLMTKINESKEPNYSPKLGFTLKQFMEELGNKQLRNVEFVKEEWDTEDKIKRLNELDAEFNNIPLEKIIEITK